MYQLALLYLACMLAGYGLTMVPVSAVITSGIASFFTIVGSLAMIIFGLAILYLGIKALLGK
ncbi:MULTISPECIES: hypothetical protein [unclassified Cytobacillus]|jgi:hypothetical protein|uniref:hypothetical protein n=1 Tax=unclassified Cytobacillus TaxID=2675268 RepID=UPI001356849E|nr:hypothetical protein [Cytobacillus sp. AMY 15.2]KAF0816612.1 hypothetical protein KIS4809_4534 [Bacillus sp. ZZV12-4809]MCM3091619.1 hypothetical protein [Cytobacillus sp. AMY 15.2]